MLSHFLGTIIFVSMWVCRPNFVSLILIKLTTLRQTKVAWDGAKITDNAFVIIRGKLYPRKCICRLFWMTMDAYWHRSIGLLTL